MGDVIHGQPVIAGEAEGETLVSEEPLSFWGGYDHQTGEIIDRRHPLSGQIATGRILALPFTRGSSTTTAVLLEAIKASTAPAAILTTGVDSFFALASIVADELYSKPIPVVALTPEEFATLKTGERLAVKADGRIIRQARGAALTWASWLENDPIAGASQSNSSPSKQKS